MNEKTVDEVFLERVRALEVATAGLRVRLETIERERAEEKRDRRYRELTEERIARGRG